MRAKLIYVVVFKYITRRGVNCREHRARTKLIFVVVFNPTNKERIQLHRSTTARAKLICVVVFNPARR